MPLVNLEGLKNLVSVFDFSFPFSKEYAEFFKENYSKEIVYYESRGNVVPLQFLGREPLKQAQLLAAPENNGKQIEGKELVDFLNELIADLKKDNSCIRLIQPHPMAFTSEKPAVKKWCAFGTYITLLHNKSDEELLTEFDPKYKKAVVHSIKNGGTIRIGHDLVDEFYTLYLHTCTKAKIHADKKEYFQSLIHHLPHQTTFAIVNEENGTPIGGAFFIFDKQRCYCTHAGSNQGSKLYGGMKYLHYEVMKWMRDQGVNQYDLTGVRINSSNETLQGIFKFKKGFGGELKKGYLWKADMNSFKCMIYDLLLLIKLRGKKQFDIIDQEN